MKIIVGKTAGFCFGVKNAVIKTLKELEKREGIYCLGELVHNKQVTESLLKKGVKFIDNIEEGKDKVIIRSHGVEHKIYEKAKSLNIELVDLTCPKVLNIHNVAKKYSDNGYYIILVGQKEHPEMIGTISFCGTSFYVLEDVKDIKTAIKEFKKSNKIKMLVISQTTFSMEKYGNIVRKIKQYVNIENLEIQNTICNATKERQEETEKIAKQVQTMIIIGGKNSSNSNKLYELAKKYCSNVLFIETEKELNEEDVKDSKNIGIMAGASTPQKSIDKVIEKLQNIC